MTTRQEAGERPPAAPAPGRRERHADRNAPAVVLMVAVTAVWGSTFVVVQDSVERMPVTGFNAARFTVAALVLIALRPRAVFALDRGGVVRGVLLGVALAATYVLQSVGLQHTSSTISAFVTGMFVVFTPLITAVFLRRRLTRWAWAGTALAVVGLGLLTLRGFAVGFGEAVTLVCALCLALQIVGTGEWVVGRDPYALVVVQLLTVSVLCAAASVPGGFEVVPPDGAAWSGVLLTGVLATAVAFVVQTWAQIRINATRIAVVMTLEPVFAALVGRLAGDRLTWMQLVGVAVVLAAMYLVELGPSDRAEQDASAVPSGAGPPRPA
ncbi:DMT family transporter [Streptomyces marincola]|uniref:DMT family transporter n=1 Tax=Streptomyces marincola TaxID=2878388 RepID=UPI001CF4B255|nr:DMT family transporter [Streptomyces marincola]UCM88490.1 DMT family transporter [Streptomyces marincola]